MSQNQTLHSDAYVKVLDLAMRYAAGAKDHVIRLKHLLAAFLDTDGKVFREILGRGRLARPEYLSFKPSEPAGEMYVSSQVDRILSLYGGRMDEVVDTLGPVLEIGLPHLAAALLVKPCGPVLDLLQLNAIKPDGSAYVDAVIARAQKMSDKEFKRSCERSKASRLMSLRQITATLSKTCHGQGKSVKELIARVASAMVEPPSERRFRPISFGFIGGPGTGKTLMATAFRDAWAHAFGCGKPAVLDMSRFSVEQLIPDVCGRDPCWKDGGHEGLLTRLAARDPRGVIIIENIDKAHPGALVPIVNMLTDGKLMDEFTSKEVSFAQNIVILATNKGTSYIESGKFARLCSRNGGTIPREKLIEGVTAAFESEAPERAGILAEILAKVDAPILFRRHDVRSMSAIVGDAVDRTIAKMEGLFHVDVEADRERLVAFFIETLQNMDSAHGIAHAVDAALRARLEQQILDSAEQSGIEGSKISIVVDDLPEMELPPVPEADDALAALESRTRVRIRQARQLEYGIRVAVAEGMTTIHITNLRHTVMPSIEDASWFSVCPSDTRPEDLVGLEMAWARVRKFLDSAERRKAEGFRPDHILLYGPPGTGKTAFAKAIAHTLDRSFICVNAAMFSTSANDNRAVRLIQDLFATAERTQSIIFIDECDAIGSRERSLPTQAPVINTFLTLLDGFEDTNVLVIGATNHPDMLDSALTRPGRLHARIKVGVLRKAEDRAKLLDIFCRKAGRALPEDLKDLIVQATDGWAPANILSVMREMFDLAGPSVPTRRMFAKARSTECAGDETQRPQLTKEEKLHVAIHEAGHALAATLRGHRWLQVTIDGNADNLGFLEHIREGHVGDSMSRLQEKIDVALAGNAAERLFGTVSEGSESDFATATGYAKRIICGGFREGDDLAVTPEFAEGEHDWNRIRPRVNEILKERMKIVSALLAEHMVALKTVADRLVRHGTLFQEDVADAIRRKVGNVKR